MQWSLVMKKIQKTEDESNKNTTDLEDTIDIVLKTIFGENDIEWDMGGYR
ncbi:unnamed protein product, partial [Adineta steineri]